MNSTQTAHTNLIPQLRDTPIAIVGMASVFPNSENLQAYWDNIIQEVDCIMEVPASRWQQEDYYDPDPRTPDKTYCKRGGFIPDIDFNPLEFGLRPNILELTDVSQLLSLVVAREALKNAGYSQMEEVQRAMTGVILGVGGGQKLMAPLIARLQYPIWERVLRSTGIPETDIQTITEKIQKAYIPWEENSFPGLLGNVIAGRIANRFDLGGINCVVDAACAASLAATRMAITELVTGRTDMMLTGGVDTDNSIFMYMCFSKTPAFSRSQQVRPFDAESDGMIVGEGVGMVVLKRLADAERDGDQIYAVIKGIGASSDGRYKSIYAPRPDGQAKALVRAYEDAGISPETMGLIEAHGTGTMAGDPAEFATLSRVFGDHAPQKQAIALGSVKSQIGHTKAAAGAASLIKAALALHHKVLPPTLNVTTPNPKFNFEESPFYLNTETRPWMRRVDQTPRRAGVSSFGFGGTNFHVVLEEYQAEHTGPYRLHDVPQTMLFAADSPAELLTVCQEALTALQDETAAVINCRRLAEESKNRHLSPQQARLGFVAQSVAEASKFLQIAISQLEKRPQATEWTHPKGVYYRHRAMETTGKVVALFSGQGSQYLNMGRQVAMNFPPLRQVYQDLDQHFTEGQTPVSSVVFPKPVFDDDSRTKQELALQDTEYAQPAIGALSAGLYKILQAAGFQADFTAGHSFGELTALWAGGVLSEADYLNLVKVRGQAMSSRNAPPNADSGTMVAVTAEVNTLKEALKSFPEVTLANLNAPEQVVLAGATDRLAEVKQYLEQQGFSTVSLPVSAAFHTPLVEHAQRPLAEAIYQTQFNRPQAAVYSNTTSQPYPDDPAAMQQTLAAHLLKPVLFKDEIENIYNAGGTIFVEFGPRNILTNLVKKSLGDRPHLAVALNPSRQKDSDWQLRDAVVQLQVAGVSLQDIDRYQPPADLTPPEKMPLQINISGHSYVSRKAQAEFETALQDGYQLSLLTKQTNGHHSPSPSPTEEAINGHTVQPQKPANGSAVTPQKPANGQHKHHQPAPPTGNGLGPS